MSKLELARPQLRLLLSSLSFASSPLFPDVRGAITQDLLQALDTKAWQFESHDLFVVNEGHKRMATLEPDTLMYFVGDPPAEPDALRDELLRVAEIVFGHLRVDRISNFAMHVEWHMALQRGSGLSAWLHSQLGLSGANQFFDAFGGRPSDTEAKFLFEPQEDIGVHVELKVMDADEAAEESFFDDDSSSFPDESLRLALWRMTAPDDGHAIADIGEIWADSYSRVMRMSERAALALGSPS